MARLVSSLSIVLLLAGCKGLVNDTRGKDPNGGELEGDQAGECSDGADNDVDGYFDCQDNDCWNSPDCEGYDPDDPDNNNNGDGACDIPMCDLTKVEVAYLLEIKDWKNDSITVVPDCAMYFEGGGNIVEVDKDTARASFKGGWDRVQSTCNEAWFGTSVWYDNSGEAFHSFTFDNLTHDTLFDWVAHKALVDHQPDAAGQVTNEYYIVDMFANYDHNQGKPVVDYTETFTDTNLYADWIHTIRFTFTKK